MAKAAKTTPIVNGIVKENRVFQKITVRADGVTPSQVAMCNLREDGKFGTSVAFHRWEFVKLSLPEAIRTEVETYIAAGKVDKAAKLLSRGKSESATVFSWA